MAKGLLRIIFWYKEQELDDKAKNDCIRIFETIFNNEMLGIKII